jgi:hypothetical protein
MSRHSGHRTMNGQGFIVVTSHELASPKGREPVMRTDSGRSES